MSEFEKELIVKAFKRCYGLKDALIREGDTLLRRGSIESLSYQAGLRTKFVEDNFNEIIKL